MEEKQLEEEIGIALGEFVYKMKLPRLNLNKIYGNFGSEVECLLSPFFAGKLIHESTDYCSKNSFLESSNYIKDILNQKERNKDINNSITDGLYIDDWDFINIDKDGSFYIKAKDVLVIKNKAVIGIVENIEFLGYKYKFLSSISQVGTEFKSYKDVCKIENKKIVKVNYESPSVLCKLDILI
ncbi:metallopeptidase TldD-related protein [Clostridium paraputrificum]|uniref:metallopeptidase TldD-related protein n=2 Tax=Clostridiaceae TaxID=31979 RepID=UPI0034A5CA95